MYKGCINMLKKRNKKGFTLVELLAVIVILAVVILIAVTAVIPRMNNAKKKALLDEALMYLKAAKESIVFDADQSPSCINVSNLNEKYIKKSSDSYTGVVKNEYDNGELSQTINLTNGSLYIVGTDSLTSSDVKSTMPKGFASSCADYNPVIAEGADTNALAYKLLMSEGGSTLDDNLSAINQRTSTVNFGSIENDASKSGLYKAEDDDGATFYYRGVISNNWVEFGGFYWRVVRINGDGSVRMIYSGLKNSTHTTHFASIYTSKATYVYPFTDKDSITINVPDVSGLTNSQVQVNYANGRFANTYVGFMYNPQKILSSYRNDLPNNSRRLNTYQLYSSVDDSKNDYYFFKDFDLNNNCFLGNGNDESGSCLLTCRTLGVDCVSSNWYTLATTEGNYSTTAEGVYPATNPTQYIYTSPFKYTCWAYGQPVLKNNSDNTTSVYVSCPLVSEILGVVDNQPKQARVRFHGLFSESVEAANSNVKDTPVKKELELWYENNIFNKKDSTDANANNLEDYIADEIFCNDRSSSETNFPLNNAYAYSYGSYKRLASQKNPTFKCENKQRDAFTLSTSTNSIVSSTNKGNGLLKYPVALITADELAFAGGKHATNNTSFYLNSGQNYWTMSPFLFQTGVAQLYYINSSGNMTATSGVSALGIRPVINLKASVLYDSGSGTEADPYKVKLSS